MSKPTQPELEKAISAAATIVSEINNTKSVSSSEKDETQTNGVELTNDVNKQINDATEFLTNGVSKFTSKIFDDSQQLVRENIITTGIFKEGEKPPTEILKSIIGVDTSTTTNAMHSDIMNTVAKDLLTMTPDVQFEYIIQLIDIVNNETDKIKKLIAIITDELKNSKN